MAENTDLAKVRGAYESGDSIFISIIDEGTEDALVPASGWIDEEAKLHLVARDFDDNKTYSLELGSDPTEPIEAKVEDGIEAGGEPLGGTVKAEDGKLLVSEIVQPVGPVPVAEFDGVAYFHKQEFDLEAIAAAGFEQQHVVCLNLLTGEIYSDFPGYKIAYMATQSYGPNTECAVNLHAGLQTSSGSPKDYTIFPNPVRPVDYTSKSFVCTDADTVDDGEIHLPTCSAYYGFLSEDGKTFISYYNLKGEGPAEVAPVTKIKDASNHEAEIHDARIPEVSAEDVGKVLGVNEQNALAFIEATGGEKTYDGSSVSTVADLLALIGIDMTPEEVNAGGFYKISGLYNAGILVPFADKIFIVAGKRPGQQLDVELMYYGLQPAGLTLYIYSDLNATLGSVQPLTQQLVPIVPQDTSKVYVLQCINGALTWIEEPDAVEIG